MSHWTAERIAAERERVLSRRTIPANLPDVVSVALVGMSFVDGYPLNVRHLERLLSERYWDDPDNPSPVPGLLRHRPDNEYDRNAVEVHFGDVVPSMLGHLPRAVAARIAPDLAAGVEWRCELVGVRTHPDNPGNPGVDVRLTRCEPTIEPGSATVEDVIREAVAKEGWGVVNYELVTRDLSVPDGIEAMRAALVEVYIQERQTRTGGLV